MIVYDLVFDNEKERQYKVENADGDEVAYVTLDKVTGRVTSTGKFSIMFGREFTESLVLGTLKFKADPPKHFVYGVG